MPQDPQDHPEHERKDSPNTGTWSVEGGVMPVWVDKEEPPPLYDSNKLDPLPSILERLGLRFEPSSEDEG